MRGEQMLSCLQQGAGGVRRVPILLYPGTKLLVIVASQGISW